MSPQLTILTPTWNRRHLLPRLYRSLLAQEVPAGAFEWLVVDDGSTDGTADWLEELSPEAPFPMRVIRQENGGKHRAMNRGVKSAAGEWCLILDSDDRLVPGCLGEFLIILKKATQDVSVGLVLSPMDFHTSGKENTNLPRIGTPIRYYSRALSASKFIDCSQTFRTEVLLRYPFPEIPGETFMAEGWVVYAICETHMTLLGDRAYVEAEYQPGGLSDRSAFLRSRSPISAMLVYRMMGRYPQPFSRALRFRVNFWRYYYHALKNKIVPTEAQIPKPWPSRIYQPFGRIAAMRDEKTVESSAARHHKS